MVIINKRYHQKMVQIDPEIVELVETSMKENGQKFSPLVNSLLRKYLEVSNGN